MLHSFEIVLDPRASLCKVVMDGQDISGQVVEFVVRAEAEGSVPRVSITYLAERVEIVGKAEAGSAS